MISRLEVAHDTDSASVHGCAPPGRRWGTLSVVSCDGHMADPEMNPQRTVPSFASSDASSTPRLWPATFSATQRPRSSLGSQQDKHLLTPVVASQGSPSGEKHSIGFLIGGSDTSSPTLSTAGTRTRSSRGSWDSRTSGSDLPQPHIRTRRPPTGPSARQYRLEVVQQPYGAAEFGDSAITRLPVAPPVVVQCHITDGAGLRVEDGTELPFLVAHLSISNVRGYAPGTPLADAQAGLVSERLLYGSLVSSPHVLRDLQGKQGVFFLFPDVSIRLRGMYQLGITLMSLSPVGAQPGTIPAVMGPGSRGRVLAQTQTRPFEVLPRQEYVAPPQTPLTQYFIRQGVRMYAFAVTPSAALQA